MFRFFLIQLAVLCTDLLRENFPSLMFLSTLDGNIWEILFNVASLSNAHPLHTVPLISHLHVGPSIHLCPSELTQFYNMTTGGSPQWFVPSNNIKSRFFSSWSYVDSSPVSFGEQKSLLRQGSHILGSCYCCWSGGSDYLCFIRNPFIHHTFIKHLLHARA